MLDKSLERCSFLPHLSVPFLCVPLLAIRRAASTTDPPHCVSNFYPIACVPAIRPTHRSITKARWRSDTASAACSQNVTRPAFRQQEHSCIHLRHPLKELFDLVFVRDSIDCVRRSRSSLRGPPLDDKSTVQAYLVLLPSHNAESLLRRPRELSDSVLQTPCLLIHLVAHSFNVNHRELVSS